MKVEERKGKDRVQITASNSKAGGDWLQSSSADTGMMDSKSNMRQQCTLTAVKDDSILDNKSVTRRYEGVVVSFHFVLVKLYPKQCLPLVVPGSN